MTGVAWAFVAGIGFGLSQIANRGVNRRVDALSATTVVVTAMLVVLLAALAITGRLRDLWSMPPAAAAWFTAAALVHFLVGWTLFAVSQQRVGASRTASVLSVNPVVAALVAAAVIGQELRPVTWLAVVTVTIGVALVAGDRGDAGTGWRALWAVAGATLMFSISPLLVTRGLSHYDNPLVGLTAGIAVAVPAMHVAVRVLTGHWTGRPRSVAPWVAAAGLAAGFAIAAQWTAFALVPIGIAISLQQVSTLVVLAAGPVILHAPRERPDARLLSGAALIVTGAVLVALFGRSLGS